jgi:hypothetical protein
VLRHLLRQMVLPKLLDDMAWLRYLEGQWQPGSEPGRFPAWAMTPEIEVLLELSEPICPDDLRVMWQEIDRLLDILDVGAGLLTAHQAA